MFLLGLVIACGIEVLVDTTTTLSDIAVLRDRVRERGTSYAGVLTRALAAPIAARDEGACEHMAAGVFDDPEVIFVRATTDDGEVVFERSTDSLAQSFREGHAGADVAAFYRHQLDRDARGVVADPKGLAAHLDASRHRDFAQKWSEALANLGKKLGGSTKAPPSSGTVVLYQDALYVENATRALDGSVTYAVGRVDDTAGNPVGAVIVAFDMTATNAAVRGKYLKGLGMIVFFVGLIIVQNVLGRREKLRLLDLEAREMAARDALRGALPATLETETVRVTGALSQATRVIDGVVWDRWASGDATTVAIYDPQGTGIDAAAVALHVLAMSRAQRASAGPRLLEEELAVAGAFAEEVPLTRALGTILVRVGSGALDALVGPLGEVRLFRDGNVIELSAQASPDAPSQIVGPLRRLRGEIRSGDVVAVFSDGLLGKGRLDVALASRDVLERQRRGKLEASDVTVEARRKATALVGSDIAVVLLDVKNA